MADPAPSGGAAADSAPDGSPSPVEPGAHDALLRRRSRRRWIAVALSTAALAAALICKDVINVWLISALAGLVATALAAWSDGRRLLALLRPRKRDLAAGLAAGAGLVVVTHLLYPLASELIPLFDRLVGYLYADLEAPPGARAALPVTALVILAEELVWRGVLMEELRHRLPGRRLRVLVATLLYALPHTLAGIPALVVAALAMGLAWTLLRLATGRLVAPLLCHLVWSLTIFTVWPLT